MASSWRWECFYALSIQRGNIPRQQLAELFSAFTIIITIIFFNKGKFPPVSSFSPVATLYRVILITIIADEQNSQICLLISCPRSRSRSLCHMLPLTLLFWSAYLVHVGVYCVLDLLTSIWLFKLYFAYHCAYLNGKGLSIQSMHLLLYY